MCRRELSARVGGILLMGACVQHNNLMAGNWRMLLHEKFRNKDVPQELNCKHDGQECRINHLIERQLNKLRNSKDLIAYGI